MPAEIPATVSVLRAAVQRLLTESGPMRPEHLLAALRDAGVYLGREPEEALADLLDDDELPVVLPLTDGRHAWLPALLTSRVFTHRLSATEVAADLVTASPDLEPLVTLADEAPYDRLSDGSPLVVVIPQFDGDLLAERGLVPDVDSDAPAFLLPPGRLALRLVTAQGD